MGRIVNFPSGQQVSAETWMATRDIPAGWNLVAEAFATWKHLWQAKAEALENHNPASRERLKKLEVKAWERYMRRTAFAIERFQQGQGVS